ncbi:kinase-like domain-containing protein [Chytridium lagenaria]|nr:kinase-like domain-containing protein [Chytridium lagenaria]
MADQQNGTPEAVRKRGPKDFEFGREIGSGSYSTVFYAKERGTLKDFAVKILDKKHIIKEKKTKYVTIEKEVLHRMSHPFIIKLFYTFQTQNSLYFVLEYASKGDLQGALRKLGKMDIHVSKFYTAEVLTGVDHLHKNGIIHRDLKPELTKLRTYSYASDNHIKIADFGSAKILSSKNDGSSDEEHKNSFVGTAEYCSPELLNDRAASFKSDPPFRGANEYQTFQKIMKLDYNFPEDFPAVARRLIELILHLEPENRPGIIDLKDNEFFQGLSWNSLDTQTPPIDIHTLAPLETEGSIEELLVLGSELSIKDDSEPVYPFEKETSMDKDLAPVTSASQPLPLSQPSTPKVTPRSLLDEKEERQRALQRQGISRVGTLVDSQKELILLVGSVNMKRSIFSRKRGMLLTDQPRLVLFDEDKMSFKEDIPVNSSTSVTLLSQKSQIFEDLEQNAHRWVDAINREIEKIQGGSQSG